MPNRLASATSSYLLQHKDNPVDWWPWCDAAFAEARRLDKPILLSVGYAACHWCHVMAHESFEDPEIAAVLNANFLAIKVDREERPDVDAVYLQAAIAMTGQGGWPLTAVLTPEGVPLVAATYFPPARFRSLLETIAERWRTDRAELRARGADLAGRIYGSDPLRPSGGPPATPAQRGDPAGPLAFIPAEADAPISPADLDAAVETLARSFDDQHGGFGGAPKFPPAMVGEFLLRSHARTADPRRLGMVVTTAEAMARGGIYDQLAGGFARYSVDASWTVPHFEKMLSDNALLVRLYTHLWRAGGPPWARRVAIQTAQFVVGELRTPEGMFAASLDADSDGGEGRFYVWTPAQLTEALGATDGAYAARLFAVDGAPTFEHGTSVLCLPVDPDDPERAEFVRSRLLAVRERRVRPARDDLVVAAWNGLAIGALAEAGVLLDRADLLEAASRAAHALLARHLGPDDRLVRTSRAGRPGSSAGVAEDYADLADGLLSLHQASGDPRWLDVAGRLLEVLLAHFPDAAGGFYDTADDAEELLTRPVDLGDSATPGATSATAGALLSYAALTSSRAHRVAAFAALARLRELLVREPRFAGHAAAVAEAALAGPAEIAVPGPPGELARLARWTTLPGAVVVTGPGEASPLLAGRPAGALYVCRGFACDAPVTDVATARRVLQVTAPGA